MENFFKNYLQKKNETVVSILEQYYLQKFKSNLISERSFAIYKSIIQIIKASLPNVPIYLIQTNDIYEFSNKIQKFSNNTISKAWNSLNLAFRIAYSRRLIKYNLMQDEMIIKPISNKAGLKIEALTIKEQLKLVKILKKELQLVSSKKTIIYACLLCLYTGMRIGEALALCKDSVDLKSNTLTVKRTLSTNQYRKSLLKQSHKDL